MDRRGPSMNSVPFGRYLLKERLAQGGMGEVFRAIAVGEAGFEKPVVVKRILPAHAGRSDLADLFVAEAKLMTRLAHPNIVEVLDFGRGESGEAFLVLELVKGVDLGRLHQAFRARGEPFPIALALFIAAQTLRGLHHAHSRSAGDGGSGAWLVHRDVSPGNVLLSTEGEVKVADFGVALVTGPGDASTPTGLVGKPPYMAPEQFDGRDLDPRADLFSVGVLLFELLTGSLPFTGPTLVEQQARAHRGEFPAAASLRADVPAEVDAILRRALAPLREGRFPDGRAMAQAIEGLRDAGVRLAGTDDIADAVLAAMRELPEPARPVIALSAEEPERELTRTGGPTGVGAFTMRLTAHDDGAKLGVPTAVAAAEGERSTQRTLPIEAASAPPAPPPSAPPAPPAAEAPPPPPPVRPLISGRAMAIAFAIFGIIALIAYGLNFRRRGARRHEPAAEPCEGMVRITSFGRWTVSGGPETVESPGLYTWKCGTFSLVAVSRNDASRVKYARVVVHPGPAAIVELR